MKFLLCFALLGLISSCFVTQPNIKSKSDQLVIKKISDHTYVHTSYLQTEDYGRVACNGMIVIDDGEAVVIDAPTDEEVSKELIDWVKTKMKSDIVAVVATHFHMDCLGGLEEFHNQNITSYAHYKTTELAREHNRTIPYVGFEDQFVIEVGNGTVVNQFLGEGHTVDNIVSYYTPDDVLFGGCLIKSLGAGKGNLEDANIAEWSHTVRTVKAKLPSIKKVIPGHGNSGGMELLDYTIEMFAVDN